MMGTFKIKLNNTNALNVTKNAKLAMSPKVTIVLHVWIILLK
jgi:hypothetical protein